MAPFPRASACSRRCSAWAAWCWVPPAFAAGGEWRSHGYDDAGTRFSPLTQITPDNAKELGLAWSYDLHSSRGVEATPLVVDGVMYATAAWSIVHAIDVRTGKKRWEYDPKVPPEAGRKACCDAVNRGVAYHEGMVSTWPRSTVA
ncbi:PQQ-binding-like beta-propeller repeat protein [Thauera humireducens]|uniref:PQQ-binding-like beta-propeller repeat protein n=1 Tax=Thauera humireducens TaxID=1134435 RepID=UPI00311D6D08